VPRAITARNDNTRTAGFDRNLDDVNRAVDVDGDNTGEFETFFDKVFDFDILQHKIRVLSVASVPLGTRAINNS
jgi:hypothetical protein